ncbi:MAG TPA: hypothetical protein VN028_06750 [Rhodocyclaceae bacterium]|nr:hypothetical protein [Rhodocyclaceae bacterium]
MATINLSLAQWLDKLSQAFISGKHTMAAQLKSQLTKAGLGATLARLVGERGKSALGQGDIVLAAYYLQWLEELAGSDWPAQLMLAELRHAVQDPEAARAGFAAHIHRHPVFRYQPAENGCAQPIRCAILLTSGDGSQINFTRDGFALKEGLTAMEHLVRVPNCAAAMVFCEGLRRPADLDAFDVVINAISDADKHEPLLHHLQNLLSVCSKPIINHPTPILANRRDQICKSLVGKVDFVIPRLVRVEVGNEAHNCLAACIDTASLRYPVLARPAGTQTGIGLVRLNTRDEAARVEASPGSYYVSEYHEFRSADGYYRKYRSWSIDGVSYPNHLFVSDSWNVHGAVRRTLMQNNPSFLAEDKAFGEGRCPADSPRIEAMMCALREVVGLDYFGVDFGIDQAGRPVFFEANPTMLSFDPEMHAKIPHLVDVERRHIGAFQAMLHSRLFAGEYSSQ